MHSDSSDWFGLMSKSLRQLCSQVVDCLLYLLCHQSRPEFFPGDQILPEIPPRLNECTAIADFVREIADVPDHSIPLPPQ